MTPIIWQSTTSHFAIKRHQTLHARRQYRYVCFKCTLEGATLEKPSIVKTASRRVLLHWHWRTTIIK